jgi:hypothetical protein
MYAHQKNCSKNSSNAASTSRSRSSDTGTSTGSISLVGSVSADENDNRGYVHINTIDGAITSYITDATLDKLVQVVKRPGQAGKAIVRMVTMIYFSRGHPENYCSYVSNKRQHIARVWDGSQWAHMGVPIDIFIDCCP